MKRGFTLIELLVVIAIVGLLGSIVLASVTSARENARLAGAKQFSAQLFRARGAFGGLCLPFDEGVGAVTANILGNQQGTILGSPAWTSDTPSGQGAALVFDGTNPQAVTLTPSGDLISATTRNYTYAAWVKPTAATGGGWIMGQQGNHAGLALAADKTPQGIIYFDDLTFMTFKSTIKLSAGKWYYVALSVDSVEKTISIYVDGISEGKTTYTKTLRDYGAGLFRVGTIGSGSGINAIIDDPCVYLDII